MKIFRATTEERFVWNCPYCKEFCDDECDDPSYQDSVICEHCGEESKCDGVDR